MATALALPAAGQVSAYVSGNVIYWSAGGARVSPDQSHCVTTVLVDEVPQMSNGNAPPCYNTPSISSRTGCNWVGTHVVSGYASNPDDNRIDLGSATVTVSDPPPASCGFADAEVRFENASSGIDDTRILLSNVPPGLSGVPSYGYPRFQSFLGRDAAIPVGLRTIKNGVATPGVPVVLKVLDPPDRSPYVAGGPGIVQPVPGSRAGDNVGALPKLTGSGVTDNGNGTYSVTSGANGYVGVVMELDASARAGDNYKVEATATFDGGLVKSATSAEMIAWKRLFVEKRQMFRRGAPLATDAPAGITRIIVRDTPISSTGERFARNDNVMLLHAPPYGQAKGPGSYYSGLYRIGLRPQRFTAVAPVVGPGTVTTNGTTLIVGVDGARDRVRFDRLTPGDVINIYTGGVRESRVVTTITDRTHLTVDKPTISSATGLTYEIGDYNLIPGTRYLRLTLDRPLT
ncbi:MAG TPA: hypothetical protein VNL91_08425 [Thermoanaerobaculia bacterium]|nr:hypothetical protein [Thermoanaerobaculia bacterium]